MEVKIQNTISQSLEIRTNTNNKRNKDIFNKLF